MSTSRIHRASAKGEKLAWRLAHIIARLHQGGEIDKHQLATQFQVDVRTIERDLGERLQDIAERDVDGHWQLTHRARSTIPVRQLQDYARLTGTQNLFPDSSLQFMLEQLQIPQDTHPLHAMPVRSEDLRNQINGFGQLQDAIQAQHECRFNYKGKPRLAQPYRLIHKNGIWYLAAVESGQLKNFSVGLITALEVDKASRFTPDPAHHDYINRTDDVWCTTETTEVLLRVAPEVAHYFTRRPLLPQQQQHADTDGSLIVTTYINHPNQLLPLVRYWMPHMRILRPAALHEVLLNSLQQTLALWQTAATTKE